MSVFSVLGASGLLYSMPNDPVESAFERHAALVSAKLPSGLLEPLGLLSLRHLLGRLRPCRFRLRLWVLLFGHTGCGPSMSRSIGEALTDDALECQFGPLHVVEAEPYAKAVPEIELGKVAMQMLLATV